LLLATRDQVEAVRKLVATFDLPGQAVVTRLYTPRHVPTGTLALLAERLDKVFASRASKKPHHAHRCGKTT
jgi:hypothetical protein